MVRQYLKPPFFRSLFKEPIMTRFSSFICNFFTLVLAAGVCGILAFVVAPHITLGIQSMPSLAFFSLACCAGYFSAMIIHRVGYTLLSGDDFGRPWCLNPTAGVYLLAALGLVVFACYYTAAFTFQIAIARGELTAWGTVSAHMTITLLVLAFVIGLQGAPARHNQAGNEDYEEPAKPPYAPPLPPAVPPSSHLPTYDVHDCD
jgi:hypothetical protein